MTAESLFVHCPDCARVVLAEAPPCPDGHGDDCPDLVCLDCGAALIVPLSRMTIGTDVAASAGPPRSRRSRGRPAA